MVFFDFQKPNSSEELEPWQLRKKATQASKEGDFEKAISLERKALTGTGSYEPVKVRLRLARFIQQAGRNDEGWSYFNKLLATWSSYPEVLPIDYSQIYDSMRLFLQREGKTLLAVRFGVISYYYWCIGLSKQKRIGELNTDSQKEVVSKKLKPIVNKAKCVNLLDPIVDCLIEHLQTLPKVQVSKLIAQIDQLLSIDESNEDRLDDL